MSSTSFIHQFLNVVIIFATDILMPFMLLAFIVSVVCRGLIYFTVKRHDWFAREFEKKSEQIFR